MPATSLSSTAAKQCSDVRRHQHRTHCAERARTLPPFAAALAAPCDHPITEEHWNVEEKSPESWPDEVPPCQWAEFLQFMSPATRRQFLKQIAGTSAALAIGPTLLNLSS